ncbi:class F sortase [Kitasatospora sp. NPDC006697]|uniref:class F sortase n=1 Tax=Kitasatospora sp. NPDC006697 TaxID=3364020 RepID=UPI0036C882AB
MPTRPAEHGRGRRPGRVPAAAGGALALALAGLLLTRHQEPPPVRITPVLAAPTAASPASSPPPPPAAAAAPATPVAAPAELLIPELGVAAPVVAAGLDPDGSAAVPPMDHPGEVDWYDQGPRPGEPGPAVLLGHYDTHAGPAVFHRLPQLRPGDRIEVRRTDGSTAAFRVRELRQAPKDAFPTEAVYGDTAGPQLRLITCGGVLRADGHYSDNIIVFADPVTG